MTKLLRFLCDDEGPTAVEYAVMLGLIIAVCLGAISLVGDNALELWTDNADQLDSHLD